MESLKNLRIKTGISQRVLALLLKTRSSEIAMAERGEHILSSRALIKIAEIEKYFQDESFQLSVKKRREMPATGLSLYKERCKALVQMHTYNISCLKARLVRMQSDCTNLESRDFLAQEKLKHKIYSLECDHKYLTEYLEKS